MSDRLILERECEHGEYDNGHWFRDSHPFNTDADWCRGGTRRELTAPAEMIRPTLVWIDYDVSVYAEQPDGYVSVDGDAVVVAAALGLETAEGLEE